MRNKGNWNISSAVDARKLEEKKTTRSAFKGAHFPFSGPVSTCCHPDRVSFFAKSIVVLETRLSQSPRVQTEADILSLLLPLLLLLRFLRLPLSPNTLLILFLSHLFHLFLLFFLLVILFHPLPLFFHLFILVPLFLFVLYELTCDCEVR